MAEITSRDAAARLGVSRCRINELLLKGRLKGRRLPACWLIEEESVRNFKRLKRGPKLRAKSTPPQSPLASEGGKA